MKTLKAKRFAARLAAVLSTVPFLTVSALATEGSETKPGTSPTAMAQVVVPIVELLDSLMKPLLAIVVAVGGLYCVLLGVKYAKAEEPQDREKAKSHLKNAVIGFVLIFVLVVLMNLLVPVMETWVNNTMIANGGNAIF